MRHVLTIAVLITLGILILVFFFSEEPPVMDGMNVDPATQSPESPVMLDEAPSDSDTVDGSTTQQMTPDEEPPADEESPADDDMSAPDS